MIGYDPQTADRGDARSAFSMVFMLPQLANRVDFISVGTNDLTVYSGLPIVNTRVASIYDSLHPAIIRRWR